MTRYKLETTSEEIINMINEKNTDLKDMKD